MNLNFWGALLATVALAPSLMGDAAARVPGPEKRATPTPTGADTTLPRLKRVTAKESQVAWMGVKALGATQQAPAVVKKRLLEQVCTDLLDLRALSEQGKLTGFGFRDNVRQRSWARPSLALLLDTAMERFVVEAREARNSGTSRGGSAEKIISIGDVSQAGCGQLYHGVLVFHADGARADALRSKARLVEGRPTIVEHLKAADFPWEADRFGPPDERVMVVTELLGENDGELRFARTRYRELAPPTAAESNDFASEVSSLMARGAGSPQKTSSAVVGVVGPPSAGSSTHDGGATEERWVTHTIDPKTKRQALVVTREKPSRRLDWGSVVEVRLASWQDKKPGSFPNEVRWRAESVNRPVVTPAPSPKGRKPARVKPPPPLGVEAVRWSRWSLVSEAGHISHLSGIDADLSYVSVSNERHFAVDPSAMDVPLTWRWLEILVETGKALGTPIESILVDASIKRHLMKNLPMKGKDSVAKSPVWRLLTLVGGHDAHHHIRIVEPSAAYEKKARAALGR